MTTYCLVQDRMLFEETIRPTLARAWHQRSFLPCLDLVASWAEATRAFASRYHIREDDLLLLRVLEGLPFERGYWRSVVGELLLVAALEIPELPAHLDSLRPVVEAAVPREIELLDRALRGSRDLTFGLATYRPENVGFNDAGDVAILAEWFGSLRSGSWTGDVLASSELDEVEREEELAYAREWLGVLGGVYARAAEGGRVVVLEAAG